MININKESYLKSNLPIREVVLLYLLYNKKYELFTKFMQNEFNVYIKSTVLGKIGVLKILQQTNYIRVEGDDVENITLTSKTINLFTVSTIANRDIELVIEALNKHSNSAYRPKSKSTVRLLNARFKEYSLDDVINTTIFMCKKWKNSSMDAYLRPETLYNETKFQNYYNEWYKTKANKWQSTMK